MTDEEFKTFIRTFLQRVIPQEKSPLLVLPESKWGELLACLIFVKQWKPLLTYDLGMECDVLWHLLEKFKPEEENRGSSQEWIDVDDPGDSNQVDANCVYSFLVYKFSPHFNVGGWGQWIYNSTFGPYLGFSI